MSHNKYQNWDKISYENNKGTQSRYQYGAVPNLNGNTSEQLPTKAGLCHINVYVAIATLGVFACLTAAPMFGYQYHNFSAMSMATLSMIAAGFLLHLYWSYKKQYVLEWNNWKFDIRIQIGRVLAAISFMGMVICLISAGINGTALYGEDLEGENLWITSVWFFMFFKWNLMLAMGASKFKNIIANRPLTAKRILDEKSPEFLF